MMFPFDRFLFTMATFATVTGAIFLSHLTPSTWTMIGISILVGLSNVIGYVEGQRGAERRYNPPR